MNIKTSELSGAALDWAVAYADDLDLQQSMPELEKDAHGVMLFLPLEFGQEYRECWQPTNNWNQGGPIIEREKISLIRCDDDYEVDSKGFTTRKRIPVWAAEKGDDPDQIKAFELSLKSRRVKQCYCDNCFYGRTTLANELLNRIAAA